MNTSTESRWEVVLSLAELGEGEARACRAGGRAIALYKIAGEVFATDNVCTHGQALLSDGFLDGCMIECPLHQGLFDVRTGKAVGAPATQDLRSYAVRLEGDRVLVALPDAAAESA